MMRHFIALGLILSCLSAVEAQQISSRFQLMKMDKNVNTFHQEGAPMVSPDGNTLYFFVLNHPDNTFGSDDTQDIWMTKKEADGKWSAAAHLKSPFNIHKDNQLFTVFEDGTLFIKGGRSKGEKGFSLVTSGGSLQELDVKDFKNMNKGRFYGATMSSDKKHMIINMSEKEGSISGDLYISHASPDGSWTKPVRLAISSPQDDVSPFISPDQKTLYFASSRQAPGRQGQTDIYKCERLDETWTKYSTPVNVGKPINTGKEDFYFTMDKAGNVFTAEANNALEGAQLDLYMLVPKTMSINLEGTVVNAKTNEPLQANVVLTMGDKNQSVKTTADGGFKSKFPELQQYKVSASAEGFQPKEMSFSVPVLYSDTTLRIEIPLTPVAKKLIIAGNTFDKKTEQRVNARLTITLGKDSKTTQKLGSTDGRFEQEVSKTGLYVIMASAEGYLNATDSVDFAGEEMSPVQKDIYLQPIEVGVTVVLKNIYFDFDKTTLKSASNAELNKVVDFLKDNPSVEIEISGHTDNKGSDDYNEKLSQGRSEEVVRYIVGKGIDKSRLQAHGYGEAKPIDSNDTDEGRANNRRVEFTILKK